RYADSDGYEKDGGRPFAWRYRNWVLDALNADLPYDRFVIEQLAGDLLPGATVEQKAATGFHRNTLTNREGGVDQEQFRVEAVVDRVNTTAKVWLGLTLGCAQCHDHKYDPLSQREYYQFFAFFNSDKEMNLLAPLPNEGPAAARRQAEYARKLKALEAAVEERRARLGAEQAKWEKGLTPAARKDLAADVQAALAVPAEKRTARQAKLVAQAHAKADAELQKRTRALAQLRKAGPPATLAPALALGPARKTHV